MECSGWVGVTLARNPSHREGKLGALNLVLAPARDGECYGPQQGLRTGLNLSDDGRARRTGVPELWRAQINYGGAELWKLDHGSEFLTSGQRLGRLGTAPGALDG